MESRLLRNVERFILPVVMSLAPSAPAPLPSTSVLNVTVAAENCLHCGTALRGRYCHVCGQKAGPRIVPFRQFVAQGAAEHFGVDGRVMRTLRTWILQPGEMTRSYLAGHYVRYVHPLRLYLVFSALAFLVISTGSGVSFFVVQGENQGPVADFMALLPKLMIVVVVPGSALVLKMLYPGRVYLEHLVFALHYFAFFFALSSLLGVIEAATAGADLSSVRGGAAVVTLGLGRASFFAYAYLALRRVYGGGRAMTVLKTVAFGAGFCVVLVVLALAVLYFPSFADLQFTL